MTDNGSRLLRKEQPHHVRAFEYYCGLGEHRSYDWDRAPPPVGCVKDHTAKPDDRPRHSIGEGNAGEHGCRHDRLARPTAPPIGPFDNPGTSRTRSPCL